jgi:hypothetical protein
VAACKEGGDMLPIVPGGGGTGSSSITPDAAEDPDGGGGDVAGRVCLLSDPRDPAACAASGADGLTVTLGSATATTAADGSFAIASTGTNLTWFVNGTGIEPTAMRRAAGTTIPVLASLLYGDMIAGMSAIVTTETGGVIVRLRRAGAAFTDAAAVVTPTPDSEVYYDGPGVTDWDVDATGPFGVIWISAVSPGTVSLALDTGTLQRTVSGIPVFAGTLTFELAEIP